MTLMIADLLLAAAIGEVCTHKLGFRRCPNGGELERRST